ncbi:hypothetical protein [Corallococcus silvisoli]|uniref:hypothetical protein n=1 Tax=Corallococcus silvisoli TaxID=2697031 RepID=UPI0013785FFF|nr:hypothetical protein [Corallococcus silvisoli]NBD10230.1 hypothetical protein [Corallococcus silvisoli]
MVEIAGPLLLGLLCGALFRKTVYPQVLRWAGSMAAWVNSPANAFLIVLQIGVSLAVAAACHDVNAPVTLKWLQEHISLPRIPLTPGLLHGAFLVATFLCGYLLANLPSSSSEEDGQVGPA